MSQGIDNTIVIIIINNDITTIKLIQTIIFRNNFIKTNTIVMSLSNKKSYHKVQMQKKIRNEIDIISSIVKRCLKNVCHYAVLLLLLKCSKTIRFTQATYEKILYTGRFFYSTFMHNKVDFNRNMCNCKI